MLPAHQRLDSAHRARLDFDDRLIVQEELVALQGVCQVRAELEALEHLLPHARPVDLPTALAVVLGGVHGDVGVAQQALDRVVRIAEGDADRRPGVGGHTGSEGDRLGKLGQQPIGDLERGVGRLALDEHGELVAAQSGDRVGPADDGTQAAADLLQHAVAGGVAEAVVDGLEVVEVDAQHRRAGGRRLGDFQRLADALAVQGPVAEACERVVRGVVLEPAAAGLELLSDDRQPGDDEQEQDDRPPEQWDQLERQFAGRPRRQGDRSRHRRPRQHGDPHQGQTRPTRIDPGL